MSAISIKQLLESGVHFGHQTRSWNPKMREYIFGERNGIHIIDLQQTMRYFRDAVDFASDLAANGKEVLFVGTKRQAHEAIEEEAARCGMHYVTNRWLGGLLTNFTTVRQSIKRYKELESMRKDGFYDKLTKKEVSKLERERKKLDKNLRGIRDMEQLPGALFVVDSNHEAIAVKEANRLGIPIIAIVDTNCDPDVVDYIIPGNDDALRSVKLFTETIAEAILAGRAVWDVRVEEQRRAREKQAREEEAARKAAEEARARRVAERAAAREAAEAKKAAAAAAAAAQAPAEEPEAEAGSNDEATAAPAGSEEAAAAKGQDVATPEESEAADESAAADEEKAEAAAGDDSSSEAEAAADTSEPEVVAEQTDDDAATEEADDVEEASEKVQAD